MTLEELAQIKIQNKDNYNSNRKDHRSHNKHNYNEKF